MSAAMKVNRYKSPLGKLAKFFELSRNKWKDKCKTAKRGCRVSQEPGFRSRTESRSLEDVGLGSARSGDSQPLREELEQLKSVRSH